MRQRRWQWRAGHRRDNGASQGLWQPQVPHQDFRASIHGLLYFGRLPWGAPGSLECRKWMHRSIDGHHTLARPLPLKRRSMPQHLQMNFFSIHARIVSYPDLSSSPDPQKYATAVCPDFDDFPTYFWGLGHPLPTHIRPGQTPNTPRPEHTHPGPNPENSQTHNTHPSLGPEALIPLALASR